MADDTATFKLEANSNSRERSGIHSRGASGGSGGRAASAPQLNDDGANALSGTLEDEIYLGDRTDWRVRVGEETLTVAEAGAMARARRRGEAVTVSFPPGAVLRLEEAEGDEP